MKKTSSQIIQNTRGFTLTEMLIVIALIALVGTFVTGNVMSRFQRAKVDATKIQMKNLGVVLDDYKRECGNYPTTDQGLDALVNKPASGPDCKNYDPEGYVKGKKVPKDGWDRDFLYESDGNKYLITSLGNDGKAGGEALDKDITSDDPN
jgi:general secretion pathway protein G